MKKEGVLRVSDFAKATGYTKATIRKKLYLREISYHKVGRIIVIPESEVERLLEANFRPRILET